MILKSDKLIRETHSLDRKKAKHYKWFPSPPVAKLHVGPFNLDTHSNFSNRKKSHIFQVNLVQFFFLSSKLLYEKVTHLYHLDNISVIH